MSKKLTNLCSLEWLKLQTQTNAIIGGILSIIHPEQYNIGIAMLRTLRAHPEQVHKAEYLPKILGVWNAPFNVMTLMSNRLTPFHRDNGAASPWYDMLVPLGHYSMEELKCLDWGAGLGMILVQWWVSLGGF